MNFNTLKYLGILFTVSFIDLSFIPFFQLIDWYVEILSEPSANFQNYNKDFQQKKNPAKIINFYYFILWIFRPLVFSAAGIRPPSHPLRLDLDVKK